MKLYALAAFAAFAVTGCRDAIVDPPDMNDDVITNVDPFDADEAVEPALDVKLADPVIGALDPCASERGEVTLSVTQFQLACQAGARGMVWPAGVPEGVYVVTNDNTRRPEAHVCCYTPAVQ